MKRPWLLALGLLAFALAASTISTFLPHRLYGKRIAGQVVDAETGNGIPGAYVAFYWESGIIPSGFTGHNSRDICYHAAATQTNDRGRFEIAPWQKWSTYDVLVRDPLVIVYAPHYVPDQFVLGAGAFRPPIERFNERYAVKPFTGTPAARMYMLFWGLANHACFYGGGSQKSLYPMLRAVFQEATAVSRTKDDQATVQIIARLTAEAAISPNPNGPIDDERVEAFIRGNLQ